MAVAATVHHAALELPSDNRTHHVGIGTKPDPVAEFQTEQAVHAVKVGLAADKLDGGLRGFSPLSSRDFIHDIDQVKFGKRLHISCQTVQAFFRFSLRGIGFVKLLADHAQVCMVLLLDGGIGFDGGRKLPCRCSMSPKIMLARVHFVGFECLADIETRGIEVDEQRGGQVRNKTVQSQTDMSVRRD